MGVASAIAMVDSYVKKLLLLLIVASLVIGLAIGAECPGLAKHLKPFIPAMAFVMVYSALITMRPSEFVNALRYPKAVGIATVLCLFVAPLMMAALSRALGVVPAVYAGLVLVSLTPPGGLLVYWTSILEGRVGVAAAVSSITLLAALVWIPVGMLVFAGSALGVKPPVLFSKLLVFLACPLAAAMATRAILVRLWGKEAVRRLKPACHLLSSVMALLMCLTATAVKARLVLAYPAVLALPALAAVLYYNSAYVIGFCVARSLGLCFEKAVPVTYAIATKNLSIAMGLAASAFDPLALLGVVSCALFQMPLASLWYRCLKRRLSTGKL